MGNSEKIEVITGPLVWVDCEMTGLDPKRDKLLEIAVSQHYGAISHLKLIPPPLLLGAHNKWRFGAC